MIRLTVRTIAAIMLAMVHGDVDDPAAMRAQAAKNAADFDKHSKLFLKIIADSDAITATAFESGAATVKGRPLPAAKSCSMIRACAGFRPRPQRVFGQVGTAYPAASTFSRKR